MDIRVVEGCWVRNGAGVVAGVCRVVKSILVMLAKRFDSVRLQQLILTMARHGPERVSSRQRRRSRFCVGWHFQKERLFSKRRDSDNPMREGTGK